MRKLLLALLAVCFVLNSCKKINDVSSEVKANPEEIINKFFNENRTTDPKEAALVKYIKQRNDKENFVIDLVEKIGYPRWDKMMINNLNVTQAASFTSSAAGDPASITYIPFVRVQEQFVNAAMVVKLAPSDSAIKINKDWQYKDTVATKMTPKNYMLHLMNLDNNVFGNRTYKIKDTITFGKDALNRTIKYVNINNSSSSSPLLATVTTTVCYTTFGLLDPNNGPLFGGYPQYGPISVCNTYFATYDIEIEEPINGGVGGPESSGSTSSNSPTNGSGGAGGMGVGYTTLPNNTAIQYLITHMGADGNEPAWLNLNSTRIARATEIKTYLVQHNNSAKAVAFCWQHLNKMMSDADYLAFVIVHAANGNPNKMWWEDEVWLSNPSNFKLDIENSINNNFEELTPQEIALIALHPMAAYTINLNVSNALSMADTKFGGIGGLNDKKDAFRHAYFNAINTRDVVGALIPAYSIVSLFAIAHEQLTPPLLLKEKDMDLHNNDVGIQHCLNCLPGIDSDAQIANAIMVKLNNGELYYLKPTRVPKYKPNGELLNALGDPNFWGANGTVNLQTATHGIFYISLFNCTILESTNN